VKRAALPYAIRERRVIAVARGMTPERAPALAQALLDGGIGVLEVTVEEDRGIPALRSLEGSGMLVGAGTVTSISQAAAAVDAGASFLVSPHHDPALTAWAADRGVPFIPGALTPTEIHAAWDSGAAAVKVFPASVVGPDAIAAIKAPFPEIDVVPTGGITAVNAPAYIDAGALAVGVGGWLTGHTDHAVVSRRASALVEVLRLV
jgi:2-dehydro-3-deoxyphosphogluconate aldolase / (4S)-4-hydroxy-2-oxoglutarate aldolase